MQYLTSPNSRWAYHTGAYRKMEDVIATASGITYNNFTQTRIKNAIGMSGLWVNYVFYSRVRDAARFGLLTLNRGIWNTDTLLHDTAYFNSMINTSQNFNLSYGYLWWLNGKPSFMAPSSQIVFNTPFFSNAPSDLIAALGKDDQKIYVVPSQNMVVVRLGNSAYGVASAFSPFDNELWGYIDSLNCSTIAVNDLVKNEKRISISPNPFTSKTTFTFSEEQKNTTIILTDVTGRIVNSEQLIVNSKSVTIDMSGFAKGIYFVEVQTEKGVINRKIIKE